MKVPLSWLRRHLETDAGLQTITDTLTAIGLEVDGVEDRAAALMPFRVATVVSAVQHPNADRLRACEVDAGDGLVSVVCGAPNARAGMRAVLAMPGAFIPGTGITLKAGEIRGLASAGMLLSRREMGLGDEHDGILELPDDAPVGTPYPVWAGLDDPVIEVSVTPNRGDALGVRGIARDLAAAGIGTLKPWSAPVVPAAFDSPISWAIDWPEACPWVLGRTVRGVRNGPSPAWLGDALRSVGLRPISALVDVTNWFTIDLGRPLHVFDADRVTGGVLTMRRGAGETIAALNGKAYVADPEDCVIADAAGAQSLAGVIGGEATGCTEATTTVFIECALFDPVRVALTGRRHQLTTDARQRFERGVDPALPPAAMEAATAMIVSICGGEASSVVEAGTMPAWQRVAQMRFERIAKLGGVDIGAHDSCATLERLGFDIVNRGNESVRVAVPSWRHDIAGNTPLDPSATLGDTVAHAAAEGRDLIEPEVDLIEEVLRLHGLDRIAPVSLPPVAAVPPRTLTPAQSRAALARRVLAAAGMIECVTFSFMPSAEAALFGGNSDGLRLINPIASDLDQMRPTPVATLLAAAARNAARGTPDVALFEVGPAYLDTSVAGQFLVAAGVRTGTTPRHWSAPSRDVDAIDARGDALAVLAALGVATESLTTTADAPEWYHPGRSGVIRQGPKTVLAIFGALHPRVLATLGIDGPVVATEVFLDRIAEPKHRKRAPIELAALQPIRRDYAFVVGPDVTAEAVLRAARAGDRALVTAVTLFDVYTGNPMPAGHRSLGVEVTFQPRDATPTEAELDSASGRVVASVVRATGATLRG